MPDGGGNGSDQMQDDWEQKFMTRTKTFLLRDLYVKGKNSWMIVSNKY